MTPGLLALVLLAVAVLLLVALLLQDRIRATKIIYVVQEREVMDVIVKVGETARVREVPKDANGVVDPTVESLTRGYGAADSGATQAEDGSTSLAAVEEEPLQFDVLGLTPSPKDELGNLQFSEIESKVDGQAGPGESFATGRVRVACVTADEIVATTIEHELVAP